MGGYSSCVEYNKACQEMSSYDLSKHPPGYINRKLERQAPNSTLCSDIENHRLCAAVGCRSLTFQVFNLSPTDDEQLRIPLCDKHMDSVKEFASIFVYEVNKCVREDHARELANEPAIEHPMTAQNMSEIVDMNKIVETVSPHADPVLPGYVYDSVNGTGWWMSTMEPNETKRCNLYHAGVGTMKHYDELADALRKEEGKPPIVRSVIKPVVTFQKRDQVESNDQVESRVGMSRWEDYEK